MVKAALRFDMPEISLNHASSRFHNSTSRGLNQASATMLPYHNIFHWRNHLEDKGFAVIKQVGSKQDVSIMKQLIWDDLEGAYSVPKGFSR
jgi:hypothetical protein